MHGVEQDLSHDAVPELLDRSETRCESACLLDDVVIAFVEGRLDERGVRRVDAHMSRCPDCSALVVAALEFCTGQQPTSPPVSARCWTFEPGTRVGERYVVQRALGQGGMGEVYEVFDVEQRCSLAIKTTRARNCDRSAVIRRLADEFARARRVSHPNVCRVHELGVHRDVWAPDGEVSFMSMELIEGESLTRRLQRGCLSEPEFRWLVPELLAGVSAIHRCGVIHRDIKSQNIMLRCQTAQAIIIDFGLAVDAQRTPAQGARGGSRLRSRDVEGSPAYMAPEQFWDAPIGPACDVFACGVVLFQALTGTLPFQALARDRAAGLRRDPGETPLRATALAPDVPARLDDFIACCLELEPARRFPVAAAALEAWGRVFS